MMPRENIHPLAPPEDAEVAALRAETSRLRRELENSRRLTADLMEATTNSAFVIDADGFFLAVNAVGAARLGSAPEAMVGKNARFFVPWDAFERRMKRVEDVICSGRPVRFEDEREGVYFDNLFSPVFGPDGMPRHVAMFAEVITDYKQSLKDLRTACDDMEKRVAERTLELTGANASLRAEVAQRQRAETLLRAINQVFHETITCDSQAGVARTCLSVAESLTNSRFGWISMLNESGRMDAIALSDPGWAECRMRRGGAIHPMLDTHVRGIWGAILKGGRSEIVNSPGEDPNRVGLPEGHPRLTAFLGVPFRGGGKVAGMIGLANKPGGYDAADMTNVEALSVAFLEALCRKRSEDALRESELRFRQLAENIRDVFWLTRVRPEEKVLYVSPAYAAIWGREPRLLYDDPHVWTDAIHPSDRLRVAEAYRAFIGGRGQYEVEYRIMRADGSARWIWDRGFAVPDGGEEERYIAGIAQDITDRKRDQRRMEDLVEELKNFSYIISHDLRAPLINLKGFTHEIRLAVEAFSPGVRRMLPNAAPADQRSIRAALQEDLPEALDFIDSSVTRMDRMISAVLNLSRVGRRSLSPELLDMTALAGQVAATFGFQIQEKGAEVTVNPLPEARADRMGMEQVFANLIGNAINYLDPARPGRISVSGEALFDELRYQVADNGIGVAPSHQDRIFELFQRVGAAPAPGEGMGLTYVRTVIRRHGGRIWCESEPGKGAAFVFTLPMGPERPMDNQPEKPY